MTKYSVNILCIIVGLKEQVSCVHMTFRLISPMHVRNPNKCININIYIYKYDILLTLARVITTLSCLAIPPSLADLPRFHRGPWQQRHSYGGRRQSSCSGGAITCAMDFTSEHRDLNINKWGLVVDL